jgi:hypothetical protein
MMARSGWLSLCVALGACSQDPASLTEVLVVVDSDLPVPAALDAVVFRVTGPSGGERVTEAALGAAGAGLPRSLGLVHRAGPLAPLRVRVEGRKQGATVLTREARLHFVAGRTLVLPMHLVGACLGVDCGADTCTEQGCASPLLDPNSLAGWNGEEPRLASVDPLDAGPGRVDAGAAGDGGAGDGGRDAGRDAGASPDDAGAGDGCVSSAESCNERDDDCDDKVDEGFDLLSDEQHCGMCGVVCNSGPNRTCCDGTCKRECN